MRDKTSSQTHRFTWFSVEGHPATFLVSLKVFHDLPSVALLGAQSLNGSVSGDPSNSCSAAFPVSPRSSAQCPTPTHIGLTDLKQPKSAGEHSCSFPKRTWGSWCSTGCKCGTLHSARQRETFIGDKQTHQPSFINNEKEQHPCLSPWISDSASLSPEPWGQSSVPFHLSRVISRTHVHLSSLALNKHSLSIC